MDYETLLIQPAPGTAPEGGIRCLVLNRPDVMNAMNTQMFVDLRNALHELAFDDSLRVLIFSGAGDRAFCTGGDLKQRNGMTDAAWRKQHHVHALAAAAGRRLEQHRQRQGARPGGHHLGIGAGLLTAAQHRHAGGARLGLGRCLVAQPFDDLGRGADEYQPGCLDGAREIRVLCQEAVAGVDGLRTAAQRRSDDRIDAQVALGRAAAAQADRFTDHGRVQSIAVGAGMHTGHGDAQALAGAGDAAGDLAAVGDQDFFEHLSVRSSAEGAFR